MVLAFGLWLRSMNEVMPVWVNLYLGDFLWAIAVYLCFSIILSNTNIVAKILITLIFCYLIEISQLCHTSWLDQLRSYTLIRSVIGRGFLWSDLVAYSLGIFSVAIPDLIVYASNGKVHS